MSRVLCYTPRVDNFRKVLSKLYQTPELREMFKQYGRQGGMERAKRLTPAHRKAIAKKAAVARWRKRKG